MEKESKLSKLKKAQKKVAELGKQEPSDQLVEIIKETSELYEKEVNENQTNDDDVAAKPSRRFPEVEM